jgi:hypothetical protein
MRMDQMWRTARQKYARNRCQNSNEAYKSNNRRRSKCYGHMHVIVSATFNNTSPRTVRRTRLMRTRRIGHTLRRSGHHWQSVRTIGRTTMHGRPRRESGTALGRRIHTPALTEVCTSWWAAAEVLVVVVAVAAPTATAIIGHTRHVGRRPMRWHIRIHRHVPRHRRAGSSSASASASASASTSASTRVEMQRRQDGEL